jgi:hypothetical protein
MTPTLDTNEVLEALDDIAEDLGLDLDAVNESAETCLIGDPETLRPQTASALMASVIARHIRNAEEFALDSAMAQMATAAGWQFENHNVVLWTEENGDGTESIVVWLGNMVDYDMVDVGRAVMA